MTLSIEQIEKRLTGVSGSEIAAVCGLNPWRSAIEVWQQKADYMHRGVVQEYTTSAAAERGHRMEPVLLDWYGDETGQLLNTSPGTMSGSHELIMATPDAVCMQPGNVHAVEAKAPARTQHHWADGVPPYYVTQGNAEANVCGGESTAFVVDLYGEFRIFVVDYSEALMRVIEQRVEDFWEYVIKDQPPPADGSDSASRVLANILGNTSGNCVKSTPEIEACVDEIREAKKALSAAKDRESLARNRLKELVGDAQKVAGDGWSAGWQQCKGRVSHTRAIAELAPDADLERFRGEPYTSFVLRGV